jgi:chromosome segregation ATPase
VKKKKLKKKELTVRIGRLVDQFSELNNRLNQVSNDKLNQDLQLTQLDEANVGLQQRLHEMQRQIEQVVTQEQALVQDKVVEYTHEEKEKEEKINYISDHLSFLHEQQQDFKQTLEQESQSADVVANTIDDLRRDIADLLTHIRRLEDSGSELLVSDNRHESEIQRLQNDIAELGRKFEQSQREWEKPQQEVTRLLQESAQSLRQEIEHISHQLTEKGGQYKALDQRLLELGNRIGETGARVESQQLDKIRKDEVFEQRLFKLEDLARELEPMSDVDIPQLEQQLNQVERDMQSRLADKSRNLSARLDTLGGELSEQAAKSEDRLNHLSSDVEDQQKGLVERISSLDLRLSNHIDQQANRPDPLASISREILSQKERFEATLGQLRDELGELREEFQTLNTDEHEAADWLSSIASGLDKQAEDSKRLGEVLDSTKNDIARRVEEITARLIIAERLSKEQDEAVGEQSLKLSTLTEEMLEQGRHGDDLKLTAAAMQEDAKALKESHRKLTEQLEMLSQAVQQGEHQQGQTLDQLSMLEKGQEAIREHSEQGMDSLHERVKASLAQLAEQSGLNEGLSQRLQDLEASLQNQFNDLDDRFQQLLNGIADNREMLAFQGQRMNTISSEITELQTGHQGLLEQGEKHKSFLEAMTTESGKRQEESEQMVQRLGRLHTQVASTRSSGAHQTIAIGGLFLLLLISLLFGYQFVSSKLGRVERDLSLEMMRVGENYLNRQQAEALINSLAAADKRGDRSLAVEVLTEQQQDFSQRLDELELRITEPVGGVAQELTPGPPGQIDELQAKQPVQELVQQPVTLQMRWQALRERGGYTIQLVAVSNQDSIAGFAAKHQLQGDLAYITTNREGRAWHILLYGMYESYAEASQALQRLPDSLKSQQPWARKMPGEGSISGL